MPTTRSIEMKFNFLQREVVRNSLHVLDFFRIIKLHVLILFIILFFRQRRMITYGMTYFNSEYNCDEEVPTVSYIFVLKTGNIFN